MTEAQRVLLDKTPEPDRVIEVEQHDLSPEEFLEEGSKLMDRITSIYPGEEGKRKSYVLNGKGTIDVVCTNDDFINFTLKYENSPEIWTTIQITLDTKDAQDPIRILEFDYLNRIENNHMHLSSSREAADAISQTLDHLGVPTNEELELDRKFSMVDGVWAGTVPQVGNND